MPPIFPVNMTSNSLPAPFVASASSFAVGFDPYKAFASGFVTVVCWRGTGGGVDWLKQDLGASTYAAQCYTVRAYTTANRAPKNWTFEGSNDNASWTVLDTRTNQTTWGSTEARIYTFVNATTYRYYRLNITSNNGDVTNTEVSALWGVTDANAFEGYGGTLPVGAYTSRKFATGPQLFGSSGGPITPVPVAKVLQTGTRGVAYSELFTAQGGSGLGYSFAVISGALPTGTSLASGGLLSGTPSATGVFTFTVQVTDSLGQIGSQQFQITIVPSLVTNNSVYSA